MELLINMKFLLFISTLLLAVNLNAGVYTGTQDFKTNDCVVIVSPATNPASPATLQQLNDATVGVTIGSYPILILNLGGQWTDFELKASTDNFSTLVYFIDSKTLTNTTGWGDTNVYVYFTDDYASDVRKWVKATNGLPIWTQLVDPTNSSIDCVIVMPSHTCEVGWQIWMSDTNVNLVWSYTKQDAAGFQQNATASKPSRWNPVVPVEWKHVRIVP